ncbi:MAG: hypothetical protein HQL08_09485 [Nitrospirae bacterium]|nr:hypothetical protein [Nitrospirota bacterium]
MKCRVCGREMLDRGAYYECSNILCDYEEDIKNPGAAVRDGEGLQGILLLKATILTKTISSQIYVVH